MPEKPTETPAARGISGYMTNEEWAAAYQPVTHAFYEGRKVLTTRFDVAEILLKSDSEDAVSLAETLTTPRGAA